MAILSTTLCYPTAASPTQGIFVQRRLAAIAKLTPLAVVAPIPWFPILRPLESTPNIPGELPAVERPPMFYIPAIAKRFDARFYARALDSVVQRAMQQGTVDLIDAHFEWPDGVGAWQVARKHNIPFVCTLRGKLVSQTRHRAKRRRIIEMLKNASALIAVSQHLAKLANDLAGSDLNITVIPNGIDTRTLHRNEDVTALRAKLGWQPNRRYVISVGHLQELKGFHHLIEVWPQVRKRCGDIHLVLVGGRAGEPAYERRLHSLINRYKLESVITLVGRQSAESIADMLNAADLFALASRSEGWCNAIAESLACGCPVVATNVGGNAEVMNHWGLGKLVEPNDPDALANKICSALEDPWDRAKIAAYGSQRDWSQVARECVDVLKKVLSAAPPPNPV